MGASPLRCPPCNSPNQQKATPSPPRAAKHPTVGAADWSEVDGAGAQIAEYDRYTLRVDPAEKTPDPDTEFLRFGNAPRPGFGWQFGFTSGGVLYRGRMDPRGAARSEVLGRAHRRSIGKRLEPDNSRQLAAGLTAVSPAVMPDKQSLSRIVGGWQ